MPVSTGRHVDVRRDCSYVAPMKIDDPEWMSRRRRMLALRLRRARIEANLTQRELARLAGVSRRSIQYAESASRKTRPETIRRLREALGEPWWRPW